jgi:hypothetical protein
MPILSSGGWGVTPCSSGPGTQLTNHRTSIPAGPPTDPRTESKPGVSGRVWTDDFCGSLF